MKFFSVCLLIIALSTSGCGMKRKMSRTPRGSEDNPSVPTPTPGPLLGGALKATSGSVASGSIGNDVGMRASISTSRQVTSAAGVTAHVGVGPAKKNPHQSQ